MVKYGIAGQTSNLGSVIMSPDQFRAACAMARSDKDLSHVDLSILDGFGLKSFKPVTVPIETVAACIRWQTFQFNGGIDTDALNECRRAFVTRKRVEVI
jgi:hypothetical protein